MKTTWFLVSLMLATLLACQSVPITGRSQLMLISEKEEIELGEEAYKEVMKKAKTSGDQEKIALIRRVGQRIAAVSGRRDYRWEFNLIEDKTPNAFALPGGKVAFHTGILPITQDETGIAVVMGHEVAHALAHHGAERMSTGLLAQIGAVGVSVALGGDPQTAKAVEAAFGIGVMLPFSRSHESEADHIGLHLMAKAGYDPRAAIAFWKRMESAAKGNKPPEFLSTHPSDKTRVEQIQQWLPEVLPLYEKAVAQR